MQGRRAHPRLGRQLLDAERLVEVLGDPADGPLDLTHAAVGPGDLGQARPLVAQQHAIEDLAFDQRGQDSGLARRVDQPDHAHHRVQQGRIDLADRHGPDQRPGVLGQGRLAAQLQQQVADHRRVEIHAERQIGFFWRGLDHLADHRQVDRRHQVVQRVVDQHRSAAQHLLAALRHHADRRAKDAMLRLGGLA